MLSRTDIQAWLRESDPAKLEELRRHADDTRRRNVGDAVHLRGLVEISSYCRRTCLYCGLRSPNTQLQRYCMTQDEILASARKAARFGYGTVVLQAGEDPKLTADWVADLIHAIRNDEAAAHLAITLSLGERTEEEYTRWRQAGADRYLLRFETSNRELFETIHPPHSTDVMPRRDILLLLRRLGYEIGTGVMVGIPGQTFDDLVDDVEVLQTLQPDMIGLGPYLPHPDTPLGRQTAAAGADQPANDELTTRKMIALARIVCPQANIPSTTALAAINPSDAYETGLQWGANVVMPSVTPPQYRALYEIYPQKACSCESAEEFHEKWVRRITASGRNVGIGRGDSPSYIERTRMKIEADR